MAIAGELQGNKQLPPSESFTVAQSLADFWIEAKLPSGTVQAAPAAADGAGVDIGAGRILEQATSSAVMMNMASRRSCHVPSSATKDPGRRGAGYFKQRAGQGAPAGLPL